MEPGLGGTGLRRARLGRSGLGVLPRLGWGLVALGWLVGLRWLVTRRRNIAGLRRL